MSHRLLLASTQAWSLSSSSGSYSSSSLVGMVRCFRLRPVELPMEETQTGRDCLLIFPETEGMGFYFVFFYGSDIFVSRDRHSCLLGLSSSSSSESESKYTSSYILELGSAGPPPLPPVSAGERTCAHQGHIHYEILSHTAGLVGPRLSLLAAGGPQVPSMVLMVELSSASISFSNSSPLEDSLSPVRYSLISFFF